MADPSHFDLLSQGVAAWNAHRREKTFSPDLSGADLRQIEGGLAGLNLRDSNLGHIQAEGVNLSGARLGGSYAVGANFRRAQLNRADLSGTDLSDANLSEARLDAARLINARLARADLGRASLVGADMRIAYLRGTFLGGADLRGADVRRYAPSSQHAPRSTYLNLVRGLTKEQAAAMRGDRKTTLPDGFAMPVTWDDLADHDDIERPMPPVAPANEAEWPDTVPGAVSLGAMGSKERRAVLTNQVRLLIRTAPAAEMTARGLATVVEAQVSEFRADAGNQIPDEVLMLEDLALTLRAFSAKLAPLGNGDLDAVALEKEIQRLKEVIDGLNQELKKALEARDNRFVAAFLEKGGAAFGGTVFGGIGTSLVAGAGFLLGAYAPDAVVTLGSLITRLAAI